MRTRLALSASLATVLFACGGGGTPATPTTANGPSTDPSGKAETFAEVNPDDVAALGLDGGGAQDKDKKAPAAPAGDATSKNDGPDECTVIAVDWEKRARPKLKECYAEGKKKEPDLKGTVRISVDIDVRGKIKNTKITEKSLPEPVAQCMLKVVKATQIGDQEKCRGKSLTIPITFPTPK